MSVLELAAKGWSAHKVFNCVNRIIRCNLKDLGVIVKGSQGGSISKTVDKGTTQANTAKLSGAELAGSPKSRSVGRLNVLKQVIGRIRELFLAIRERIADGESFYQLRYSSAPLWKPWRDY